MWFLMYWNEKDLVKIKNYNKEGVRERRGIIIKYMKELLC